MMWFEVYVEEGWKGDIGARGWSVSRSGKGARRALQITTWGPPLARRENHASSFMLSYGTVEAETALPFEFLYIYISSSYGSSESRGARIFSRTSSTHCSFPSVLSWKTQPTLSHSG